MHRALGMHGPQGQRTGRGWAIWGGWGLYGGDCSGGCRPPGADSPVLACRQPHAGTRPGGSILPSALRQDLLRIIKERGYRRLDEPIRLASGALSSDFIDGKEALAEWRHLRLACEAIVEAVTEDGHSFDAVGGLTMGADALAVGIAAVSDCRWFFVRKEAKQRGTRRWVEGAQIGDGDRILLVDDVVTTGGSIFKALDIVDQTGATTVAAVTLVDRTGLAGPQFEQRGIGYYPMTTYESLGIEPVVPIEAAAS